MGRINLYYRKPPAGYKWVPGDRQILSLLRKLVKGKKASGLDKVFDNLCKGFDELGVDYSVNPPFNDIKATEPVVVLGLGRQVLNGYNKPNPIIAGIGLMTHPYEWPSLLRDYPVAKYLQHCDWANEVYVKYYGRNNCGVWPSGIDTQKWAPGNAAIKKTDFLVYNKIRWEHDKQYKELRDPVLQKLRELGCSYQELIYGQYAETDFHSALLQCKAMIFLCEHESQGIACCEAMAMDVPVFAWDQGFWLDPNRFIWDDPVVPATSVPFFDERCGMTFKDYNAFEDEIEIFYHQVKCGTFSPRGYVLAKSDIKKSAENMLKIIDSVYA